MVLAGAAAVLSLRDDRLPVANGAPALPTLPADSLAADLIARVRGLDPVACELAVRAVRSRNWGGGPAEPAASDDPHVNAIVQWALDDAGGAEAVPVLGAALADPDGCVRRTAAIRLGRIESPAAAARLQDALASADPGTREAAALGLGIAEDPETIPALVRVLEDDASPRVRRAAAWALGEIE
jgi:HEAT repeat protein